MQQKELPLDWSRSVEECLIQGATVRFQKQAILGRAEFPLSTRSAGSKTGPSITCSCPSNEATRFSSETASNPRVACLPSGFIRFLHACYEHSQLRYFSVACFYPDGYGYFEKRWRQLCFLAMGLESRAELVFHAVVGLPKTSPTVLLGRHPRYSRTSTVGVVGVRGGPLTPSYSSWRFWRGAKVQRWIGGREDATEAAVRQPLQDRHDSLHTRLV